MDTDTTTTTTPPFEEALPKGAARDDIDHGKDTEPRAAFQVPELWSRTHMARMSPEDNTRRKLIITECALALTRATGRADFKFEDIEQFTHAKTGEIRWTTSVCNKRNKTDGTWRYLTPAMVLNMHAVREWIRGGREANARCPLPGTKLEIPTAITEEMLVGAMPSRTKVQRAGAAAAASSSSSAASAADDEAAAAEEAELRTAEERISRIAGSKLAHLHTLVTPAHSRLEAPKYEKGIVEAAAEAIGKLTPGKGISMVQYASKAGIVASKTADGGGIVSAWSAPLAPEPPTMTPAEWLATAKAKDQMVDSPFTARQTVVLAIQSVADAARRIAAVHEERYKELSALFDAEQNAHSAAIAEVQSKNANITAINNELRKVREEAADAKGERIKIAEEKTELERTLAAKEEELAVVKKEAAAAAKKEAAAASKQPTKQRAKPAAPRKKTKKTEEETNGDSEKKAKGKRAHDGDDEASSSGDDSADDLSNSGSSDSDDEEKAKKERKKKKRAETAAAKKAAEKKKPEAAEDAGVPTQPPSPSAAAAAAAPVATAPMEQDYGDLDGL
jgi:hypothetical protein